MKTLTTLFFAAATVFSFNATAADITDDPGIGDAFPMKSTIIQEQQVNYIQDTGQQVWSIEYEQWVNPADFNSTAKQSIAAALQELKNNPPAAGQRSGEVFIWDEVADEYQLQ